MSDVTPAGREAIRAIAGRYGLSEDAVETMARAVASGGGTMAQFNIPELGGSGQWMAGGMTMVGDMFNSGLQATVTGLCVELSNAMAANSFFVAPPALGAAAWWPDELGPPAAVGGQNQVRYAYFPNARRLAVDTGTGRDPILLDTQEHQIGGFSQQQSGPPGDPFVGITFSSQFGQFALSSLPRAAQEPPAPAEPLAAPAEPPAAPASAPSAPSADVEPVADAAGSQHAPSSAAGGAPADTGAILATIERLAALRDAGALTEEEFAAKKTELLARI